MSLITGYVVSFHVISWQNGILKNNTRFILDKEISDSIELLDEEKYLINSEGNVYIPAPLLNLGSFWKSVGVSEREWVVRCDQDIPEFYNKLELLKLNYTLATQAYLSRNGPSVEFKTEMGKLQREVHDLAPRALEGLRTCK